MYPVNTHQRQSVSTWKLMLYMCLLDFSGLLKVFIMEHTHTHTYTGSCIFRISSQKSDSFLNKNVSTQTYWTEVLTSFSFILLNIYALYRSNIAFIVLWDLAPWKNIGEDLYSFLLLKFVRPISCHMRFNFIVSDAPEIF